jgi:type VI secretion system secreted protein VgrG
MAQQVKIKVECGGVKFTHIEYLEINQSLFSHHKFEIMVAYEDIEGQRGLAFGSAHSKLVGKPLSISFQPEYNFNQKSSDFIFKGVVTHISLVSHSDFKTLYRIGGFSPTILMEGGMTRRNWKKSSVGDIFGAVMIPYPSNLLKKVNQPLSSVVNEYVAQYDENDWEFVSRLAAEHGEWLYYSGTELIFGRSPSKTEAFEVNGTQTFDLSIDLKPVNVSMTTYDFVNNKGRADYIYGGDQTPGLGRFGDFAYAESKALFKTGLGEIVARKNHRSKADVALDIGPKHSQNAADLVKGHGCGENPNLKVGTIVDVTGGIFTNIGEYQKENVGKYKITDITHRVDNIGNYSNDFLAIADSAPQPPLNHSFKKPLAYPETAKVIDNKDPKNLGRIKVTFLNWNDLKNQSTWMRYTVPYTGGAKGMIMVPEIDDHVLVSYEHGHPDMPIATGSLYFKDPGGSNYTPDQNNFKGMRFKGGNKMAFHEKGGEQKIVISNTNKKGTFIEVNFKGNGSITLKTAGDINLDAGQNINITAGNKLTIKSMTTDMSSKQKTTIKATTDIDISASMQAKVDGGMGLDLKGGISAKMHGGSGSVETGVTGVTASGPLIRLN